MAGSRCPVSLSKSEPSEYRGRTSDLPQARPVFWEADAQPDHRRQDLVGGSGRAEKGQQTGLGQSILSADSLPVPDGSGRVAVDHKLSEDSAARWRSRARPLADKG